MLLSHVTLLYRGLLASCNYACSYCPFAKHRTTESELRTDRESLFRFVDWLAARTEREWSVFLTPQGEALIHPWYQDAIAHLSQLAHVRKVAVQTNLSCRLDWIANCSTSKLGLWCSYHPAEVERSVFVRRCQALDELGVSYSVGCVGLREHLNEIEHLRRDLREQVYLWVNAFKHVPGYYDEAFIRRIEKIDPVFRVNLEDHASRGRRCRCGSAVFSVLGDGTIRRCHFSGKVLGNLYEACLESVVTLDPCSQETCRCHIGYVHLDHLHLDAVFGEGILERAIPFFRLAARHCISADRPGDEFVC